MCGETVGRDHEEIVAARSASESSASRCGMAPREMKQRAVRPPADAEQA